VNLYRYYIFKHQAEWQQNGGGIIYQTLSAEMRNSRIKLLDKAKIPEGARLLVTVMQEDDRLFWQNASQESLDKIWANTEDDVYEELIR